MVAKIFGTILHFGDAIQLTVLLMHRLQKQEKFQAVQGGTQPPRILLFEGNLKGAKPQRISCEGKQECHTLDHRVHSWLSSLALCSAHSTLQR